MQRCRQFYNRQSLSRRILVSVIINFLGALVIINIALFFLFDGIRRDQVQATDGFFNEYNRFALNETLEQAKQLMLAVMDSRSVYINMIRAFVMSNGLTTSYDGDNCTLLDRNSTKNPYVAGCIFSQPHQTIFNRSTFENVEQIMEASWMLELTATRKRVKRLNLIFQNNKDPMDMLVKTIPYDPDFYMNSTEYLDQLIRNNSEGILTMSSFYKDVHSWSNPNFTLVALRTKISFPDFTLLIEMEVLETFITRTLTRIMLSNDANLIMAAKDASSPGGYRYMASFSPLNPLLNYTPLYQEGYHESRLPTGEMVYSFTKPLSSAYEAGRYNGNRDKGLNEDYLFILHSPSISSGMETEISTFIQSLFQQNIRFLLFGTAVLLVMTFTVAMLTTWEIKQGLMFCRELLRDYLCRPDNCHELGKKLIVPAFRLHPFNFVLRTLGNIIKEVEYKKSKGRKAKPIPDTFPLNMLEYNFVKKFAIGDASRFEEIQEQIQIKSHRLKTNSYN